jgi:hypothetical protein
MNSIESAVGVVKAAEGYLGDTLGHGMGWKRKGRHVGDHVVDHVVTREAREVRRDSGGIFIWMGSNIHANTEVMAEVGYESNVGVGGVRAIRCRCLRGVRLRWGSMGGTTMAPGDGCGAKTRATRASHGWYT